MLHDHRGIISRGIFVLFLAGVLAVAGCRSDPPGGTTGPLRVGYMICNSLQETMDRFEPLTAYLSDVLGREVVSRYINTFEFEEAVEQGELDMVHTNSLLYVILNEDYDWKLLSGEKRGEHGSHTAGAIIVRRDSPLNKVADLKGKRLMFGPELAPMGYLSQYYLLLEAGLNPEMDLAYYAIPRGSFKHEKVVYAVLYGDYDAGAIPILDLETMEDEGKIRKDDFRILAVGELIPYCTFSTSPDLPAGTRDSAREALLGLTKDATARVGDENLLVLDRAMIDGFELLSDEDYEPIRRMARRANMPPFQEY